ncbi:MAG: 3-beta hydroxysteroid dehydrogenase [Rhodobacteraceae bacterium]|jgi:uronate dehydrogenase|nr:3-beta hydroxysteroid dehydrogenase [Paracoccaceae bacterium]|tara:strand:- start:618 stop:1454 length:837 start_codon:yes stop_codon:yes gene_type:complete
MKKIVLTGAAGRLGSYLREPLSKMAATLLSTDISEDIGSLYENESFVKADLAQMSEIGPLIEGADMVIHFGAIVDEGPFEELWGPNFVGSYNVWESARKFGVKRVVYASSIHAVGMYPKNQFIGVDVPHRPDGFYGLAKCFTEDLGRMYWEKSGVESVCLRIYSAAAVVSPRSLSTWLSYDDLIQLVTRAIDTPTVGFTISYGISNNDRAVVDNSAATYLGYRPKDNAEVFASEVLANAPLADPQDLAQMCHGGPFASTPMGESGMAHLKIIDDKKKV